MYNILIKNRLAKLIKKVFRKNLKGESGLQEQPKTYEKTVQYNH